ncbi:hypothetical protein ABZ369_40120, partial [Streptomyces sp. NPDC005918]
MTGASTPLTGTEVQPAAAVAEPTVPVVQRARTARSPLVSAVPAVVPQRKLFPVGTTPRTTPAPDATPTPNPSTTATATAAPDATTSGGRPTDVPGSASPAGPGTPPASAAPDSAVPDSVAVRANSPVQPVQRRPHVRRVRRAQDNGATSSGAPRPGLGQPVSQPASRAVNPPSPAVPPVPAPQGRPRRTPIGAPITPVQKAPGGTPTPAPTPVAPPAPEPVEAPAPEPPQQQNQKKTHPQPLPVVPVNRRITPGSYRPAAPGATHPRPLAPSRGLSVPGPATGSPAPASPNSRAVVVSSIRVRVIVA